MLIDFLHRMPTPPHPLCKLDVSLSLLSHFPIDAYNHRGWTGPPNQRGFIVKDFIDRNNLFVSSHSYYTSSGPPFTYHSGNTFSTIDYIIVNRASCDFWPLVRVSPITPSTSQTIFLYQLHCKFHSLLQRIL